MITAETVDRILEFHGNGLPVVSLYGRDGPARVPQLMTACHGPSHYREGGIAPSSAPDPVSSRAGPTASLRDGCPVYHGHIHATPPIRR